MQNITENKKVKWIWTSNIAEKDSYKRFRKKFFWSPASDGRIIAEIAGDSTWVLFVNGKRISGGQYSDFPHQRTFSTFDITPYLVQGENTLAVSVHYIGVELLLYLPGVPHLRMAISNKKNDLLCQTDRSWKCSADTAFAGNGKLMTTQAGFIFEYDFRHEENWQSPDFDDSKWENAVELEIDTLTLEARSVPQLQELAPTGAVLQNCGSLLRPSDIDDIPAHCCKKDYLQTEIPSDVFAEEGLWWRKRFPSGKDIFHPLKPVKNDGTANGRFLIFDLEKEESGFLYFSIRSSAGTIIDIAHGEHLDDGRVRMCNTDGRYNFTDRYITGEGINRFSYCHRRLGCRYLELHITNITGDLSIESIGLIPLQLPIGESAYLKCADNELLHLNELSKRTLHLCMHEHYEDCPWREQALWNYDARLQMLHGYYTWGNYDFAVQSLELMRKSCKDGFLTLTEPGKSVITIPMFTLAYIVALHDRLLYGGFWETLDKHLECAEGILRNALKNCENGLYFVNTEKRFWNFYEWRGELERLNERIQLPWNLYLYEALKAYAEMLRSCKKSNQAEEFENLYTNLGKNIESFFRDGNIYSILTPGQAEHSYKLMQYLMLANNLVPEKRKANLYDAILSGNLLETTSANTYFLMEALMSCNADSRKVCYNELLNEFRPMLYNGATSLWETSTGASDMDGSGSLCHGWSAVSLTFTGRYLLGVQPLEPGFSVCQIKIYPSHLDSAAGTVPTPFGSIEVKWRKHSDNTLSVEVAAPEKCELKTAEYPEFPVQKWNIKKKVEIL